LLAIFDSFGVLVKNAGAASIEIPCFLYYTLRASSNRGWCLEETEQKFEEDREHGTSRLAGLSHAQGQFIGFAKW